VLNVTRKRGILDWAPLAGLALLPAGR
jgi:hypothetical protein